MLKTNSLSSFSGPVFQIFLLGGNLPCSLKDGILAPKWKRVHIRYVFNSDYSFLSLLA